MSMPDHVNNFLARRGTKLPTSNYQPGLFQKQYCRFFCRQLTPLHSGLWTHLIHTGIARDDDHINRKIVA